MDKREDKWQLIKDKLYIIVFKSDTPAGNAFDVMLLWAILLSLITVSLETIPSMQENYNNFLLYLEWLFTILFTVEYLLRIYCVKNRWLYIFSFFGLVDLLTVMPGYFYLYNFETQYLLVIRGLRLLRVFRILKLGRYSGESHLLLKALLAGRYKITVFIGTVLMLVLIIGSLMYVIEGPAIGFTSIPESMYWAIVTLTTVGYGDITPLTSLGKVLASLVMLLGYGIIAVPTGIVTAELTKDIIRYKSDKLCIACGVAGHDSDAIYCKICGKSLDGSSSN